MMRENMAQNQNTGVHVMHLLLETTDFSPVQHDHEVQSEVLTRQLSQHTTRV